MDWKDHLSQSWKAYSDFLEALEKRRQNLLESLAQAKDWNDVTRLQGGIETLEGLMGELRSREREEKTNGQRTHAARPGQPGNGRI